MAWTEANGAKVRANAKPENAELSGGSLSVSECKLPRKVTANNPKKKYGEILLGM